MNRFDYKNITSLNNGLLIAYLKISVIIIPLFVLQLIAHYFNLFNLEYHQKTLVIVCLIGLVFFNVFKNKNWFKSNFYIIQLIFLMILICLEFVWYYHQPSSRQLISLLLGVTITGIALIKPINSIIFFTASVLGLVLVNVLKGYETFNYVNYFIVSGVSIVSFNFWRFSLLNYVKISQQSYKNMFNDAIELIFVIDQNNYSVIELNKSASKYYNEIKNKSFLNIFHLEEERQDIKSIIDNINTYTEFKTDKEYITDNPNYIPKEISFRKSSFLNKEVVIITVSLIKERKEYEKQLKESKENITKVLDNIKALVYIVSFYDNGDRQVKFLSSKAEKILQIPTDEIIQRFKNNKMSELALKEDLPLIEHKLKLANKTLKPQTIVYRIKTNNKIKWLEEKIFPKREKDCYIHFSIVSDITEAKENEIKFFETDKNYKKLFEQSLAGIYKTKFDGTIIEANIMFANMLGFDTVEELKKHNIQEFYLHSSNRSVYLEMLKKTKHLKNYISFLKDLKGNLIVVNNNVLIQNENNEEIISGTLVDITELHQTTEALKQSEEKYRLLFKESTNGILLIDLELNKVIEANENATNYLNISKSKLLNNNINDILNENNPDILKFIFDNKNNYKEFTIKQNNNQKTLALNKVLLSFNKSLIIQLIINDITDQKIKEEYNIQKLRAELAENLNKELEQEIKKRKQTEIQLIESKQYIENIFNSSIDMIITTDINQTITSVNQAAVQRLKFSKNELIGKSINIIYPKGFKSQYIIDAINNTNKFLGEVINIDKDNKEFTSYLSATTMRDKNGHIIGYMGISRDLSELEEFKKIISDQSSLIDSLFQNDSEIFIWTLNKKLELLSANNGTINYYKKINNKVLQIGKNFIDQIKSIIRSQHLEQTYEFYNKALKGEKVHFDVLMEDKNKNKYWVEVYLTPVILEDGSIDKIICLGTDITDKKHTIKLLKERESNIRAMVNAIPDLLVKVNKNGTVLDYEVNSTKQLKILKSFYKNLDNLIGSNVIDIYYRVPDFANKILLLINKSIKENKVFSQQFKYKYKGKILYFEARYSKINNEEVIIVIRNQTEEIENEKKLIESIKEKEILLKEVHHRVKNNLQIINSILNLQSSYISDEKILQIITESQNRIRSMAYIHESLYQTKNFSSVNFKGYINNLITNLVYSYQVDSNLNIIKNIDNIDLSLDYAIPCGLILNELITNALKYAYDETQKTENILITIAKQPNNFIEMSVQDFGKGLPKDFDIETTETLGLSLVHTLVDQIDGKLFIENEQGTKILIIFEVK